MYRDNAGRIILTEPGDNTTICHLPTATGIKHGGIQRYIISINSNNCSSTLIREAICMVKELCLHRLPQSSSVFLSQLLTKKSPRPLRDERNSRGTTLISLTLCLFSLSQERQDSLYLRSIRLRQEAQAYRLRYNGKVPTTPTTMAIIGSACSSGVMFCTYPAFVCTNHGISL